VSEVRQGPPLDPTPFAASPGRVDFGWDGAQRELFQRMQALGRDAQAAQDDERMAVLARGGALGLALPEDVGGGGRDLVTTALAYEGLGATLRDAGVLLAAGAHLFGVALTLARAGSAEQRRAWLPRLASGEVLATIGATEEEAGSDVGAARTLAVPSPTGDTVRVTGRKRYVTCADRAGLFLIFARAGGSDAEGESAAARAGLTALLVPRAPGVRVGPAIATAGLRGARLAPVDLDDVEVGADAVIGRAGAGMAVFQIAMAYERALVLAFRLGAMQRQLDEAIEFARRREVGGTPIARHQAVAHRVARMKLRLETSRLLVYRAAWALDRGERAQAEAALAKWHVGSEALASALDAFHLRAGAGFVEGGPPADVDDALGGTVHSGTGDVLATIVARWLGL
jgi:alkylation response protein AidB-like acyl-CoA dehydrogenase